MIGRAVGLVPLAVRHALHTPPGLRVGRVERHPRGLHRPGQDDPKLVVGAGGIDFGSEILNSRRQLGGVCGVVEEGGSAASAGAATRNAEPEPFGQSPSAAITRSATCSPEYCCWPVIRLWSRTANALNRPAWM